MSSIQKILNISSESLSSDLNMYRELDDFLLKKNGFYTFESAFHFFSSKEIKSVNNFLLKETIYKTKGKLYFSEDLFGNLFYLEDNNILFLNLETNKSEFIAHSLSQWAIELLKDYNYLSGYSLAHDWQVTHRKIFVNERLKPKKNFIFGGEYNISNLMTIDRFENLKFNSELIQQIENAQDGDKIKINIKG